MENSAKGLRRAKRAAAQSTKAYFVNGGEWDDVRALTKALQASMIMKKNKNSEHDATDSESETNSTSSLSSVTRQEATNLNNNNNNNKNETADNKIKKFFRCVNRMDNKSMKTFNKPKLELPSMMFTNYIPLASDVFLWALNTRMDELKNIPKVLHFPYRGMKIEEYQNHLSKSAADKTVQTIPKTDEELPDIFKDYYKRNRREFLNRQKQDQESTTSSSRDETHFSQESSTKENGKIEYEDIIISDNSEPEEIIEPLRQRVKNSTNGRFKNENKTENTSRNKSKLKKASKKLNDSKNLSREEVHQRANQYYQNDEMKDRLKRAESRTISKWTTEQNNNNNKNDQKNSIQQSESSSSSSDDEIFTPTVPKKPRIKSKITIRRISTRSVSKRSLRGSRLSF